MDIIIIIIEDFQTRYALIKLTAFFFYPIIIIISLFFYHNKDCKTSFSTIKTVYFMTNRDFYNRYNPYNS